MSLELGCFLVLGVARRRENVVLSPGSFATYWLSVYCSVATAVGAKLKEVFD